MRSHGGDVRGTGRAGGSPDFPSAWGNCYTRRVTEISLPIVAHGFGEALPVPLPLALLATGAVTLGVAWRYVVAIRALLVVGAIAGVALQFGTGGHG